MVSACDAEARARGHQVVYAATGPTVGLWRDAGLDVAAVETADELDDAVPDALDAVVTGTGFSTFEQDVWQWARRRNLPSLAAIDAWSNLARRFERDGKVVQPDAVAVIDNATKAELQAVSGVTAAVHIVGQPHLQGQTARVLAARQPRAGSRRVVFFSEPIRQDFGDGRGFDQYAVVSRLMGCVGADVELLIKPHPREPVDEWLELTADAGGVRMTGDNAADLLATADGAVGMTTMVLVEAHLLGLPILSLQPGRTDVLNPIIDEICHPVVDAGDFDAGWQAFVGRLGARQPVADRFRDLLRDADRRLVAAMETVAARTDAE